MKIAMMMHMVNIVHVFAGLFAKTFQHHLKRTIVPVAAAASVLNSFSQTVLSVMVEQTQLRVNDVLEGKGDDMVTPGRTVHLLWSLRQGNGYFVDSSNTNGNEPFIYRVGNSRKEKAIEGIDKGILGMKVGGIRKIDVPPSLGYVEGVNDESPGPLPHGYGPKRQIEVHGGKDTLHFEVKVTKIK